MVISTKCGPPHDRPPCFRQASDINVRHASLYSSHWTRSCRSVRFKRYYDLFYCCLSRYPLKPCVLGSHNRSAKVTEQFHQAYQKVLIKLQAGAHIEDQERTQVGNGNPRRRKTRGITDPSAQQSEPKAYVHQVPRGRGPYPMPSVLEY
jgi:hypothetical protein